MRLHGETFTEYRNRIKREREELKERLKGELVWDNAKKGGHYTKSEIEKERQKLGNKRGKIK